MSQAGPNDDMQTVLHKSAEKETSSGSSAVETSVSDEHILKLLTFPTVETQPTHTSSRNATPMESATSGVIDLGAIRRNEAVQASLGKIYEEISQAENPATRVTQFESNHSENQALAERPQTTQAPDDIASRIRARKADLEQIHHEQKQRMQALTVPQAETPQVVPKKRIPFISDFLDRLADETPDKVFAARQKKKAA